MTIYTTGSLLSSSSARRVRGVRQAPRALFFALAVATLFCSTVFCSTKARAQDRTVPIQKSAVPAQNSAVPVQDTTLPAPDRAAPNPDRTVPNQAQPHSRVRSRWHRKRPLVVGYFLQAGMRSPQPYYVSSLLANGSARELDQLNYSRGAVHAGRCSVADPAVDLNFAFTAAQSVNGRADDPAPANPASAFRGNFHQLQELKQRYPKLKILISLEGSAPDFVEAARPENRRAFVASCIDTFLRGRFAEGVRQPGIFDGIDVDWESPQTEDAANFLALLQEFRHQLDAVRPGLRLAVAVGDSPLMLPGTDFAAVARTVDQVGMMNYDYAGPWNTHTGFVAPLFADPAAPRDYSSIEHSLASYKAAGVPTQKLLMGVPFYGYSWTRVEEANHGLFQEGDGVREDAPYHKIRALAEPFLVYRDPHSRAPWRFDGDTFWTYEDPVSVRYKVSYAAREHLAGVMIWELSGDTEDAELLHTAYHALHHPLRKRVFAEGSLAARSTERENDSSQPSPSTDAIASDDHS